MSGAGSSGRSRRWDADLGVEEESKFQKFGKRIFEVLDRELLQIQRGDAGISRLHGYQVEALLNTAAHFRPFDGDLMEVLRGPKAALIVAPPGSGKSGMVTIIPYVLKSKKVLIVTPSIVISEQLASEFGTPDVTKSFFVKCGLSQTPRHYNSIREVAHIAKNPNDVNNMTAHNLVIVNAQKFGGRSTNSLTSNRPGVSGMRDKLDQFDTIIVDEAHHYPATTWRNIVDSFKGKKIVFLTATPYRGQGEKIVHITELSRKVTIVHSIDKEELEGITIRKMAFDERPYEPTDGRLRGDIRTLLILHKAAEPRLENPQALVVVRKKAEAIDIAKKLGDDATFVISGREGKKNLDDFTKGRKKIAVVCNMLREGYDNPNITLCVILLNCQSRVFFQQFCGRCMRINRELTGARPDRTVGTVLSYAKFDQKKMWNDREYLANVDPDSDPNSESESDDSD